MPAADLIDRTSSVRPEPGHHCPEHGIVPTGTVNPPNPDDGQVYCPEPNCGLQTVARQDVVSEVLADMREAVRRAADSAPVQRSPEDGEISELYDADRHAIECAAFSGLERGQAQIVRDNGEVRALNTDTSLIEDAATGVVPGPGDLYISRQLWDRWERNFEHHVVGGEGDNTIHRFYNTPEGMDAEQANQPGIVHDGNAIELRGNVFLDECVDSPSAFFSFFDTEAQANFQQSNTILTTDTTGTETSDRIIINGNFATASDSYISLNYNTQGVVTYTPRWSAWDGERTPMTANTAQMLRRRRKVNGPDRRKRIARVNKRNTAEQRAKQLLWQTLSREQRREMAEHGWFHIEVGCRRYRFKKGRIGNVERVDDNGEVITRYCCHPIDMVPDYDTVLSQMMMIIHNEAEFLRVANVRYQRGENGISNLRVAA